MLAVTFIIAIIALLISVLAGKRKGTGRKTDVGHRIP